MFDSDNVNGEGSDQLLSNLTEGWIKMYGKPPIFCRDPFGNLLEIMAYAETDPRR